MARLRTVVKRWQNLLTIPANDVGEALLKGRVGGHTFADG